VKTYPGVFLGNNEPSILEGLKNNIMWHTWQSVKLNFTSYVEAIVIAVPLGLIIGLFGPIRAMTERWVTGFRYLPITAFQSIIISWFGVHHLAMSQFLTLGVLVYLLPMVVQRVDEVEQVYLDTAKTCGASRWQRIRTIIIPLIAAKLSEDCKNLVPITWTYIVIAEGFNLSLGGLGAMIGTYAKASRYDQVFAGVSIFLVVGFIQDTTWSWMNRKLFPWAYDKR
jgi:NitT/TauT family transport system permease protein